MHSAIFTSIMLLIAAFMACLSSILGIARAAGDFVSPVEIFYWYILPALPFVVLGLICHTRKVKYIFQLSVSAAAAVLAITIPLCLIAWATRNYSGGGANIGLGILFLAMPIYIPVSMFLAYLLASLIKST